MKIAIPLLLVIVAIIACGCTATAPATPAVSPTATVAPAIADLSGIWTGSVVGHTKVDGFREHNLPQFNITEQKGRAFTGTKTYLLADGTMHTENLSGVISANGRISIVDHESGITMGEMTGPDQMELMNLEDGANAKAYLITLTRQKN